MVAVNRLGKRVWNDEAMSHTTICGGGRRRVGWGNSPRVQDIFSKIMVNLCERSGVYSIEISNRCNFL